MNFKKNKKPWPTKAAMEQVYKMKLWGGASSEFYSGDGSHDKKIIEPYIEVLISFFNSFENTLSVCDLGCGDFNIGNKLVKYTRRYTAIDIVPSLIAYNKEQFKEDNLEFQCLDIAKDILPSADCAIIRQVLQHVSNAEVQQVLNKLKNFKYVLLTEHIPSVAFIPNIDIISGQGIRLKKRSGLDILAAPFNFQVQEKKQLLSVLLEAGKGKIVTTLYRL